MALDDVEDVKYHVDADNLDEGKKQDEELWETVDDEADMVDESEVF